MCIDRVTNLVRPAAAAMNDENNNTCMISVVIIIAKIESLVLLKFQLIKIQI